MSSTTQTAPALPVEAWQSYNPRQRISDGEPEIERRAYHTAQKIVDPLRQQFAAQRVVLFGSLAHEGWFTRWSDIDLAVWGIPAEQFYQAVSVATGLSEEFAVDLVDPDDCRPAIREAIEREGIEL